MTLALKSCVPESLSLGPGFQGDKNVVVASVPVLA